MNLHQILSHRERHDARTKAAIEAALEDSFISGDRIEGIDLPLPLHVSSTISIAISSDGSTFASSHGDHTIKVFEFSSRKQIRNFQGHPRTPWTVRYHPSDSDILASGCLGFHARVWSIKENRCIQSIFLSGSIISLSFHPNGDFIAIASGATINVWAWKTQQTPLEIVHSRNIRALRFHPHGSHLFVVAPNYPRTLVEEFTYSSLIAIPFWSVVERTSQDPLDVLKLGQFPEVFTQIHLYSDGGLDISQDGQYLVTCAKLYRTTDSSLDNHSHLPPKSTFPFSPMSTRERVEHEDQFVPWRVPPEASLFSPPSLSLPPPSTAAVAPPPPAVEATTTSRIPWLYSLLSSRPSTTGNTSASGSNSSSSASAAPAATTVSMQGGERRAVLLEDCDASSMPSWSTRQTSGSTSTSTRHRPAGAASTSSSSSTSRLTVHTTSSSGSPLPAVPESANMNSSGSGSGSGSGNSAAAKASLAWSKGGFNPPVCAPLPRRSPLQASLVLSTAALPPPQTPSKDCLVVLRLGFTAAGELAVPEVVNAKVLPGTLGRAVTSVRLSSTSRYVLLGYGVRHHGQVMDHAVRDVVCEVVSLRESQMPSCKVVSDGEDEVNIAQFHPSPGGGLLYGTKRGKTRMFVKS